MITGAPGTKDAPVAYCPRRAVLDKLLVDAAAEAVYYLGHSHDYVGLNFCSNFAASVSVRNP
jgi:hypothetical protein